MSPFRRKPDITLSWGRRLLTLFDVSEFHLHLVRFFVALRCCDVAAEVGAAVAAQLNVWDRIP